MSRVWPALLTLVLLLILSFGVISPPERCPNVTEGQLRESAQASVDWFVRNQHPDGTWLYLYRRNKDVVPDEYDLVRHAGAVMGLYSVFLAIGQILGSFIGGFAADRAAIDGLLIATLVMMGVALLPLYQLRQYEHHLRGAPRATA